jgi:hypothetical protein
MGWQSRLMPFGPILLHEGLEFGVSTRTILDLARGQGVSVYLNLSSPAGANACAYTLLDLVSGRTPEDWSDIYERFRSAQAESADAAVEAIFEKNPAALSADEVGGKYFHPANGVMQILSSSSGLAFQLNDGWIYDGGLAPLGDNVYELTFRYRPARALSAAKPARMQFFRDREGIALRTPGFGVFRKLA